MQVTFAYDQHTQVITGINGSQLDFAANLQRAPVAFSGKVKNPILMRQCMTVLHDVILGDFRRDQGRWMLDPVITVHPDQLMLEAFSTDESVYARLAIQQDAFEPRMEPVYGTTNVDFTFDLRRTLQDLRSSRETVFNVGAGGFGVETQISSTLSSAHLEEKVDLPESWLKGFLQVQSALTMQPFTFHVKPANFLTVIHFLLDNVARRPPHGMRFEFIPNEPINCVLEPWNERFTMKDTHYEGYPRSVRLWGRKRLDLLTRILPYADKLTIGVLGRGLPHFYTVHLGDFTFTLVLSGWVRNDWSQGSAFDLMTAQQPIDDEALATVYNYLVNHFATSQETIATNTLLEPATVQTALFHLCRGGRVIYDPVNRVYRLRELFQEPVDFHRLFQPDPRIAQAQTLVDDGAVTVESINPSDVRANEIKIIATVVDGGNTYETLVAVDYDTRIRFAQCQCDFFRENIMNRGPCKHILAARHAAEDLLQGYLKNHIMEP